MAGKKIDFDTVRKLAVALPGAEESTTYRSPAFKASGKMFACVPTHKTAEPGSLAVCIDFDRRAELLEEAPEVYYVTDHYVDHPIVLVRLARVPVDALRDLLSGAWRFVSTKQAGRKRGVRKAGRG